jgi:uncharacterized protein DUF3303
MRFLVKATVPNSTGNARMLDGTFASRLQSALEDIKPEAAYFTAVDGCRAAFLIVNMSDASQIPAIVEPLFLGMDCKIEVHPVMVLEDLMNAEPAIAAAVQKYG